MSLPYPLIQEIDTVHRLVIPVLFFHVSVGPYSPPPVY